MMNKLKVLILNRTTRKRTIFFVLSDILLISLACYLGFLLRFDGQIPERYIPTMIWYMIITTPTLIILFYFEKLYAIAWSFISIKELIKLTRAIIIAFLAIGANFFIMRNLEPFQSFPRSVLLISAFSALILTGALRFSKRIYLHGFMRSIPLESTKVLIFGAGEAGEQIVRYIMGSAYGNYSPIGLIDDNPMKLGINIHGVKVLGTSQDIPMLIKKYAADELIIAIPSAPRHVIKNATIAARSAGLQKIKILPTTKQFLDEEITLNHIRDISIEDLLGREPIKINTEAINEFLTNKTVLITGAAGSIGSQLCREILKFNPKKLIALDQNETALFHLERELKGKHLHSEKKFILANICSKNKIHNIFNSNKPEIVFHAAAYKHVSMMENHPDEAIRNNVFGTLTLGREALKQGVKKFILISTDKAINPNSVMGASKRVGEIITVWLNQQNSTEFCAVRFGNVLDSQGNVVGIFENQIRKGGPVEVTHPEMKRYFMVTSEACLLVMQAAAIGEAGKVFVLDMGEPVKIVDLAREMIILSGLEPDSDIPIVFTGIRHGEKLFEQILTADETPTKHDKIFISKLEDVNGEKLQGHLLDLQKSLESDDKEALIQTLRKLVPNLNNK
ncbi:polysaccharide biosynthesis protein [Candidatus Kuenenbacteria bacterium]|nr:polysaccharide biosynthesis protein [Candidatus Kuenenbacteria bacterium]